MPKVTAPCFSLGARKTIGKLLTFQKRTSGHVAYLYKKPGDLKSFVPSWKQKNQRGIIGLLTAHWQVMSAAEKKVWNDLAVSQGLRVAGYNLWLREAQKNLLDKHGLVVYLSFNQGSGCQALDLSGNGNHGLLKPDCPSNCPLWVAGESVKFGQALRFDGSDDYVEIPYSSELYSASWTFEMMIKRLVDSGGYERLLSYSSVADSDKWVHITDTDKLLTGFYDTGAGNRSVTTIETIPLNVWKHLAIVFDSAYLRIYINRVLKATSSDFSAFTPRDNNYNVNIGRLKAIYKFNGLFDEVRIYNRALSLGEIVRHYNLFRYNKT